MLIYATGYSVLTSIGKEYFFLARRRFNTNIEH